MVDIQEIKKKHPHLSGYAFDVSSSGRYVAFHKNGKAVKIFDAKKDKFVKNENAGISKYKKKKREEETTKIESTLEKLEKRKTEDGKQAKNIQKNANLKGYDFTIDPSRQFMALSKPGKPVIFVDLQTKNVIPGENAGINRYKTGKKEDVEKEKIGKTFKKLDLEKKSSEELKDVKAEAQKGLEKEKETLNEVIDSSISENKDAKNREIDAYREANRLDDGVNPLDFARRQIYDTENQQNTTNRSIRDALQGLVLPQSQSTQMQAQGYAPPNTENYFEKMTNSIREKTSPIFDDWHKKISSYARQEKAPTFRDAVDIYNKEYKPGNDYEALSPMRNRMIGLGFRGMHKDSSGGVKTHRQYSQAKNLEDLKAQTLIYDNLRSEFNDKKNYMDTIGNQARAYEEHSLAPYATASREDILRQQQNRANNSAKIGDLKDFMQMNQAMDQEKINQQQRYINTIKDLNDKERQMLAMQSQIDPETTQQKIKLISNLQAIESQWQNIIHQLHAVGLDEEARKMERANSKKSAIFNMSADTIKLASKIIAAMA